MRKVEKSRENQQKNRTKKKLNKTNKQKESTIRKIRKLTRSKKQKTKKIKKMKNKRRREKKRGLQGVPNRSEVFFFLWVAVFVPVLCWSEREPRDLPPAEWKV